MWSPAAAICTAVEMPVDRGASGTSLKFPIPSWPEWFAPQHNTTPEAVRAQVWSAPATTCAAFTIPDTSTGDHASLVVPSPICPEALAPQQRTRPPPTTAQL